MIREIFCPDGTPAAGVSLARSENTRFLLVTDRCKNILDLALDRVREPKERYRLRGEMVCTPGADVDRGFSGFPGGTIAACLDRLLWTADPNLGERLDAIAANLTDTFNRARDDEMDQRARALAALDARVARRVDAE